MARPGITYDQVAAVADALFAETGKATMSAVRERLGNKGSMGTIHQHLASWNANRPKEAAPAVELPPELVKGLSGWVLQYATAARADSEERLVQLQAEALELSRSGEQLEAERETLLEQIAALTTERDQAQGAAAERAAEIERLGKEIERERQLAGAAQVEAAQAKLKTEGQAEQLADLKAEVTRLAGEVKTEAAARTEAEKAAAVLEAERDAARKEADTFAARVMDLRGQIVGLTQQAEELRRKLEERTSEAVAVSAERKAAQKDADEERTRIKGLQAHLDKAHQDLEALRTSSAAEIKALRDQYETRLAEAIKAEREAVEKERAASVENASLRAQLAGLQKGEEGGNPSPSGGFKQFK